MAPGHITAVLSQTEPSWQCYCVRDPSLAHRLTWQRLWGTTGIFCPTPYPVLDDSSTFTGHFNKPRSRGSGAGILCQTLYAAGPSGWVWHKGRKASGVLPKWMQLCFNPRQTRESEKQALMEERPLTISRSWTASSQEYGWDPTAHNLLMLKPLEASWTHSPGKKHLPALKDVQNPC